MPDNKLSPVYWTELIKRLRKFGFDGPYQGGKHPYMTKGDLVLTVPNPHRKELSYEEFTFGFYYYTVPQ